MRVLLILLIASLHALAGTADLSGLGNGKGWNDGAYYTGFVAIGFGGTSYAGLCIDALHETYGTSWDAVYVPLSDAAAVNKVMQSYFGTSDPAVYLPKLATDISGYLALQGVGENEILNNEIQHDVWAQFAPGYVDTGLLARYSGSVESFGLIVDANYTRGGTLEQAFLVDPPVGEVTRAPEPAPVVLIGSMLVGIGLLRRRRTPPVRPSRGYSKSD